MLVRTGLMRAWFLGGALCLAAPLALAEMVAKVYPVKDFSEFVSGGNTHIEITQSDKEYLRVEADAEVMQRVKVDQTGKRVSVWLKSGKGGVFSWFGQGSEPVKVILGVKQLTLLDISGGAQAKVAELQGRDFEFKARGAANVDFTRLTMDRVRMNLSGAGNARIALVTTREQRYDISGASNVEIKKGSHSDRLVVGASGASNFRGKALTARQAELNASGASHIKATVTETLVADASGASSVDYYGNPRAKTKATGASHINAKD